MKSYVIAVSLLLVCATSVLAEDYSAQWPSLSAEVKGVYLQGLIQGLGLLRAVVIQQEEPESSWNVGHRMIMQVCKDLERVDAGAVGRIISSLYDDPANAHIHFSLLFFPAAARLVGYPESEISEALRILRRESQE